MINLEKDDIFDIKFSHILFSIFIIVVIYFVTSCYETSNKTPENVTKRETEYSKMFNKDIVFITLGSNFGDSQLLLETSKKLNYELKHFEVKEEKLGSVYIFIFEKKEAKNEN